MNTRRRRTNIELGRWVDVNSGNQLFLNISQFAGKALVFRAFTYYDWNESKWAWVVIGNKPRIDLPSIPSIVGAGLETSKQLAEAHAATVLMQKEDKLVLEVFELGHSNFNKALKENERYTKRPD